MKTIMCASSYSQQVNVVLIKNGVCTLVKVFIANLMCANLLPRSCTIQRFATSDATQDKEGATMTNTSLINFSLWQLRYLDVSTNKFMCSYTFVTMPFKTSKG
jgi:hypothetical protein